MFTEPLSPIARALLGGSDEPDREVPCAICGEKTPCPGFVVAAVRSWNKQHPDQQPIRPSEMGVCCPGEHTAQLFKQKHLIVQEEHAESRALLSLLFRGNYNAESLATLRARGYGAQVHRVLNEEGQRSHAEQPKKSESRKSTRPAQTTFDDGDR